MQSFFDVATGVSALFVAIEPLIYYIYRKRHPHGVRLRNLHVRLLGLFAAIAAASAVLHAPPTSLMPVLDGAGLPLAIGATGYLLGRSVRWALHRALSRYPSVLAAALRPMVRLGTKVAA